MHSNANQTSVTVGKTESKMKDSFLLTVPTVTVSFCSSDTSDKIFSIVTQVLAVIFSNFERENLSDLLSQH